MQTRGLLIGAVLAFGAPAVTYAISIGAAVAVSFTWVGLLARYRPKLLLRLQLWLRVVDCALVYLVLGVAWLLPLRPLLVWMNK